jgi:Domain of unknown function (DUF222)
VVSSKFFPFLLDGFTTATILEHMFGVNGLLGELQRHEAAVARWCAALDPDTIPLEQVTAAYESLAHIEKLAAGARLRLAARVEASNEWRRAGHRTTAEWLARTTGVTTGAAHAELAASTRLGTLPAVADALRRGDLSTVQAAAVSDAAAVAPASAARLLERAGRSSVRELRDECARVKAAADPDADARYERIRRERSVHTYTDADGAWNLHARGPVHDGARFGAVLEALTDQRFRAAYAHGEHEPRGAYAFDALVGIADHNARAGRNLKYHTLVQVDLEALVRGAVDGDEVCEVAGVGPIPVRVARELLGESVLELMMTRGRDVATVVHLGRGPNAAQKLALLWSQPSCSRQGCDQTWTHTEVDHRLPWAQTHRTELHGLDRLCRHDHRLKTHHGWALVAGTGKRPMVPPGHPDHPDQRDDPDQRDHPDRSARTPAEPP